MPLKDRLYGTPVVGTALRVQDRYREDAADQLAASIGFFGFLSLFPLVVLAAAIGGFVVRATPGADVDVVEAIHDAIPGIQGLAGTDLRGVVNDVAARAGAIFGIGLVALLLSGMRVVNGAMVATTRVFRMPQPAGVKGWLRRFGAMLLLGVLALGGAAAVSLVGVEVEALPQPARVLLGLVVAFGFDLAMFLVAYRVLAAAPGPPWRVLLPGAAFAAAGWVALKTFGATWVARQAVSANELYGTLGGIVALLLLFYLAGRLYLYGAELSACLGERRGPRATREGTATERPGPHVAAAAGVLPTDGPAGDEAAQPGDGPEHLGDEPAPPPPPVRRPAPDQPSGAVSAATRERLATAERRRSGGEGPAADPPAPYREAIAFGIAIAAVAGIVYAAKPWDRGEE